MNIPRHKVSIVPNYEIFFICFMEEDLCIRACIRIRIRCRVGTYTYISTLQRFDGAKNLLDSLGLFATTIDNSGLPTSSS